MITPDDLKATQLYVDLLLQGMTVRNDQGALQLAAPGGRQVPGTLAEQAAALQEGILRLLDERSSTLSRVTARVRSVDKRELVVFDNVLDPGEIGNFYEDVVKRPYGLFEYDFKGDEYPIFSTELQPRNFLQEFLIARRTAELLREYFAEDSHRLTRAYVNLCRYGDMEYPHRDCDGHARDVTALYYANQSWDCRFGGETKFYNDDSDTELAVLPKPGRLVLFRGAILHMGSIPSRICSLPRYTLALKFKSRLLPRS